MTDASEDLIDKEEDVEYLLHLHNRNECEDDCWFCKELKRMGEHDPRRP